MSRIKKLLVGLLVLTFVFSLVACGSPEDTGSTPEEPATSDEAPADSGSDAGDSEGGSDSGDAVTVGVLIYKYDDAYTSSVRQALDELGNNDPNMELLFNDAKNDQATQNDQVDAMIQKGVDALMVQVVDIGAAQIVIDKAKDAGIPVVFFNREPEMSVISSYDQCRFVGTKKEEAGIIQGEMVLDLWNSDSKWDKNGDGKMNYVMLIGDPDNPEAIARTEYSVKTVEEAGIECVKLGDHVCFWDADKAYSAMEAWISKEGDNIEMIFSNNDSQAAGAISALQNAGYNSGDEDKFIPIFGVDATDEAQELIRNGFMSGTVKQDAVGMAEAVFTMIKNVTSGNEFIEGTGYEYDESGVAIRIPYVAWTE